MSIEITNHILEKIDLEKPSHYFSGTKTVKKTPEQLVGLGFRFWIAGYQTNNIEFWKKTWDHFTRTMGTQTARSTISDLAYWVQTIHTTSARDIEVALNEGEQFGRDERMAITMIAAGQHNACPALQACASALLGDSQIDTVVNSSTDFAHQLLDRNLLLTNALKK